MLPFGREVIKYYNTLVPNAMAVKGSPGFRDHMHLMDLSNRKAALMGVPSITINNLMYNFGKAVPDTSSDDIDD